MLDLVKKIFGKKERSGQIAHDRLKVVLIHDRANVSPEVMDINQKDMDISLENDDNSVALVANIPVNRMKHDAGKK